MNYSDAAIGTAKAEERKFKHFLGSLKFYSRFESSKAPGSDLEKSIEKATVDCKKKVHEAICNNFCTSEALANISKLVTDCYPVFDKLPEASLKPLEGVKKELLDLMDVFGVQGLDYIRKNEKTATPVLDAFAGLRQKVRDLTKEKAPAEMFTKAIKEAGAGLKSSNDIKEEYAAFETFKKDLTALVSKNAASADYLKLCDEVRNTIFANLGVRLEDKPGIGLGFVWMFDDAKALLQEQQEMAEKEAEKAIEKLKNKLKSKTQELAGAQKFEKLPEEYFKDGTYSKFDESGLPTHLANGEEVSAKKKKDAAKDLEKFKKAREAFISKNGDVAGFLGKLKAEIAEIEKQVSKN